MIVNRDIKINKHLHCYSSLAYPIVISQHSHCLEARTQDCVIFLRVASPLLLYRVVVKFCSDAAVTVPLASSFGKITGTYVTGPDSCLYIFAGVDTNRRVRHYAIKNILFSVSYFEDKELNLYRSTLVSVRLSVCVSFISATRGVIQYAKVDSPLKLGKKSTSNST